MRDIQTVIQCEDCGCVIGIAHEQDWEDGDGSYIEFNNSWCGLSDNDGEIYKCVDCMDIIVPREDE